ncbi:MAG: MBL fold metallo-hydrolase [Planctomycetes bacterium]|nr:MBL fold metallo-hydrolase [Planctomycetota bacterium]
MRYLTRSFVYGLAFCLLGLSSRSALVADDKDGRLDLYFIDVEGGAATLFVTPAGESLLIDSGYPDNGGRDLNRILTVLRDVAGRQHLDHAVVSHWHLDHFGNHAALANKISVRNFWDRGLPDTLPEDPKFPDRAAAYRAACQNKSQTLKVGDLIPLKSGQTQLTLKTVTASGDVLPNAGDVNPFADQHQPQPDDPTDNAQSLSLLLSFGSFRFLTCGDLTWNVEARLVTPRNPVGKVDLFMVTHHGLGGDQGGTRISNNPAFVWAIDPVVTVMCNGPEKGGDLETQRTLRKSKSIQAMFQLHRNVRLTDAEQTAPEFIANAGTTADCQGVYVKASIAPDGKSYTVQIGPQGKVHKFATRSDTKKSADQ